jgi:hypothetical protein
MAVFGDLEVLNVQIFRSLCATDPVTIHEPREVPPPNQEEVVSPLTHIEFIANAVCSTTFCLVFFYVDDPNP